MTLLLEAVGFDSPDPAGQAGFWADLLGRDPVAEIGGAVHLPGTPTQVGLRFDPTGGLSRSAGGRSLHLHVTSETPEAQAATVSHALEIGGRHLDVGQLPEERHVVLADATGAPWCVIEAGNGFLAGTGRLGEVACDGTREVGFFWAAALGWPLVWDRDGETAIQAPEGGTKLAWGGPPVAPKAGRNLQRFDLLADDRAAEVDRLAALGARLLRRATAYVEMADPDGNEFRVG